MMVTERKRVVLTVQDKVNIVSRLKEGEWGQKLTEGYGVGTAILWDIKRSAEWILNFFSQFLQVKMAVLQDSLGEGLRMIRFRILWTNGFCKTIHKANHFLRQLFVKLR